MKWDVLIFSSRIAVSRNFQAIRIDKTKNQIVLENGFLDCNQIPISLTPQFLDELENCLKDVKLYHWKEYYYCPCVDGERWAFEMYNGEQRVLFKVGYNAYPKKYKEWLDFYSRMFNENGITEIHTCYNRFSL